MHGLGLREVGSPLDSGGQRRACGGEHFATIRAFMLYTSGQRRYAQSGGASPMQTVGSSAGLFAHARAGSASGRPDVLCFEAVFCLGCERDVFPFQGWGTDVLNPERTNVAACDRDGGAPPADRFSSRATFLCRGLAGNGAAGHRAIFSSVRMCVSAGEALPAEILNAWKRQFAIEISTNWLDGDACTCSSPARPGNAGRGPVGFPVPVTKPKIVDDNEESCVTARSAISGCVARRVCGVLAASPIDGAPRNAGIGSDRRQILLRFEWILPLCGRADDCWKVAGMWVSPVKWRRTAGASHAPKPPWSARPTSGAWRIPWPNRVARKCPGSEELAAEICEHVKARLVSYKVPREVRFAASCPKL